MPRRRAVRAARIAIGTATLVSTTARAPSAAATDAAATDAAAAHAAREEPRPSGPRLALRSGFAVPVGQAFVESGAISDTVRGYVPIRLDMGCRIARHLYVGVLAQLAGVIGNGCPSGASCSGTNVRLGVMVAYHLSPSRSFNPWLGAGIGFEQLSVSRSVGDARVDIAARGLELLDLELGADYRPTPALRIGPVMSTSIGRFTSVAVNGTATSDFDTALHAWMMLGFRGAYDL